MPYRVLVLACRRSIHYAHHAILDLRIFIRPMSSARVDEDRFRTLSIYSRASLRRISKNIHTHTYPGAMADQYD